MDDRNIERDRAVARAMGWANVGARWRPPGTIECASGPLASTITHSRVHRLRALPDFTAPANWPVLIEWLRSRPYVRFVELSMMAGGETCSAAADWNDGAGSQTNAGNTIGDALCELVLAVARRREGRTNGQS